MGLELVVQIVAKVDHEVLLSILNCIFFLVMNFCELLVVNTLTNLMGIILQLCVVVL